MNNKKALIGLLALMMASVGLFTPASGYLLTSTYGGKYDTTNYYNAARTETVDSDYTGIGSDLPPAFFDGTTWDSTKRPGTSCPTGGTDPNFDNSCQWTYPTYPLNCLPLGSGNTPRWRFAWFYSEDRDPSTVFPNQSAANMTSIKDNIRAAASMFAASTDVADLINTGGGGVPAAAKGRDRTPRIITDAVGGKCLPHVDVLTAPKVVMERPWLQTHNPSSGAYEPGLLAWLYDNGGYQTGTNWVLLNDPRDTANSTCDISVTQTFSATGVTGPSGTGYSPTASSANKFGQAINMCQVPGTLAADWDVNSRSPRGTQIAHEMGHASGVPHDNSNFNSFEEHINRAYDVMSSYIGATPYQNCSNDAGTLSAFDSRSMSATRFDCNHDDYWARTESQYMETWAASHWSMSENAFLWGGPKPATLTGWDVRQINPNG